MKPKHASANRIPAKSINPVQYDAEYYCSHCELVVGGLAVTPQLHHSKAAGGCGRRVHDGPSPDCLRIQPTKKHLYERVIPRDLFNEASLLKCYGRIYINSETACLSGVELRHDGTAFDVRQDFGSGDIYLANVELIIRSKTYRLRRPLNSRDGWPLFLINENEEYIPVFADDGSFSPEMISFCTGPL